MITKIIIVFLVALVSFSDIRAQSNSYSTTQNSLTIQGFKIILLTDSATHPEVKEAISLLTEKLVELTKLIKPEQLLSFRKIPIWIEWEILKNGVMCYHKSSEWLITHGYPIEKTKCIEVSNIKNFIYLQKLNQPYMVLHEFAHAFHDVVLGSYNPEILSAFKNAQENKKYDNVSFNLGGKKRAYALTSVDEYFAELTEAYFGENDYYPFNKSQLKEFDPIGYELMKKIWD